LRVPDRLIQHACVALAVVTLPLLAPRAIGAAPGAAALPPVDSGVQVSAAIERQAGPLFTERPAQVIRVAPGDTLAGLATTFHVDAATLRWANDVKDVSEPAVGTRLIVPPQSGALVRLPRTESPSRFAADEGLDPRVVLDYNTLADDSPLRAGTYLQVPRTVATAAALDNTIVVPEAPGVPAVPSTQKATGHDDFPYGQCTYYVATRRNVTWAGNGGAWYAAARAAGRPVGHTPVVGAIAVMWGSWYGHVAYVERVNPDGSFVVSEWNVAGWAVYDQRTLTNSPLIIGFIY
jgi:surface antigen